MEAENTENLQNVQTIKIGEAEVTIAKVDPVFTDERGSITDLLNEHLNHVGLITTEAGAVRGNHYHKLSRQYSYIPSGKFEVLLAPADKPEEVTKVVLKEKELITIPPMVIHTFKAIETADMIDMISESRGQDGYEQDTVRIKIEDPDTHPSSDENAQE